MTESIEYRVRPVTRYIVTRYEAGRLASDGLQRACGSVTQHGEFDNADTACAVGYALAKQEHDRLGWPIGDMRIKYPEHPATSQGVMK